MIRRPARARAVETKEKKLEFPIASPTPALRVIARLCPRPPTALPAGEGKQPGTESELHTRMRLVCF